MTTHNAAPINANTTKIIASRNHPMLPPNFCEFVLNFVSEMTLTDEKPFIKYPHPCAEAAIFIPLQKNTQRMLSDYFYLFFSQRQIRRMHT